MLHKGHTCTNIVLHFRLVDRDVQEQQLKGIHTPSKFHLFRSIKRTGHSSVSKSVIISVSTSV